MFLWAGLEMVLKDSLDVRFSKHKGARTFDLCLALLKMANLMRVLYGDLWPDFQNHNHLSH